MMHPLVWMARQNKAREKATESTETAQDTNGLTKRKVNDSSPSSKSPEVNVRNLEHVDLSLTY